MSKGLEEPDFIVQNSVKFWVSEDGSMIYSYPSYLLHQTSYAKVKGNKVYFCHNITDPWSEWLNGHADNILREYGDYMVDKHLLGE